MIDTTLRVVSDSGVNIATLDKSGIKDEVLGSFFNIYHTITWPVIAAQANSFIHVCQSGIWQVAAVHEAHTVATSDAGGTVDVLVCPQAVAIASGVTQLTAPLALDGTAPEHQAGVLIAAPTLFRAGDCLALAFAVGTTALVGDITVTIKRVG